MVDKKRISGEYIVPVMIGVVAFVLAIATVWQAIRTGEAVEAGKPADPLAPALLQVMALVLGIYSSFAFGKLSARSAAEDLMAPHARSSFRRVLALYQALGRFRRSTQERLAVLTDIATENGGVVPIAHVEAAMALLSAQAFEQLGTANDALEDWRDIVPTEVEKVENAINDRQGLRLVDLDEDEAAT